MDSGTWGGGALVERDRELAALAGVIDQAVRGRGSTIVIEGQPGAGKTVLLEAARRHSAEGGVAVLHARGREIDRDAPLAVLGDLFHPRLSTPSSGKRHPETGDAASVLATALGFGTGRPGGAPDSDRQLRHGAYWLVADLSGCGPMAIVVDDIQWADPVSLAALATVSGRLRELSVALILAHRPELPVSGPLAELLATSEIVLRLAPLSEEGVAAVLHRFAPAAVDCETVRQASHATGGNPFLVVQVATALRDEGAVPNPAALQDITAGVSRALGPVLRMRVGRLGPEAVAVAQAVAVLGDDSAVGAVCAVAGLSRDAGLQAAAALAGAGILAPDHVTAFAHPLVRAAIDGDVVAADRMRLEDRAVAFLLDTGADVARISEHLLHTEPGGDDRAVVALQAAARRATLAAAPGRAALLLRRAAAEVGLSRWPSDLSDDLITAEFAAGHFGAVVAQIRTRLGDDDLGQKQRGLLVRWLGRAVMQSEGIPAAVATVDDQLLSLDADARLYAEAEQAWMCMLWPPLAGRVETLVTRARTIAGHSPGERAALAMAALAITFSRQQPAAAVVPLLARAFANGALLADDRPEGSIYAMAAYAILQTEELHWVEEESSRAVVESRRCGSGSGLALALILRAMGRLQMGRIGDAETDAVTAIEAALSSPGTLNGLAVAQGVGTLAQVRAERGDDRGAFEALAQHGFLGDLDTEPQMRALFGRACAHLAAGRVAEALADARRRRLAYRDQEDLIDHSALVETPALVAMGDTARGLERAEWYLASARPWGTPSTIAAGLRLTGLARGGGHGIEALTEARAVLAGSPAALESVRCQVALGMLQRRAGYRRDAMATLRAAAHDAQQLGALRTAEQARSELLLLGARPRRLALTGANALTAAERRVARLAAEGRSNRQIAQELFISLKTVDTHLGHAFRKLQITSRIQLAAALDHDAPPSSPALIVSR